MIVNGNLLDAKEKYIVHQCNCVTTSAAFLAKSIFDKYPYADIYSTREKPDTPGEISITGNGQDQRYVIGLFGQYYPGKVNYLDSKLDGTEARKKYFHSGLQKILCIPDLESIAFPYGIGCGAAGGDWGFYESLIRKFADTTSADVKIYQKLD